MRKHKKTRDLNYKNIQYSVFSHVEFIIDIKCFSIVSILDCNKFTVSCSERSSSILSFGKSNIFVMSTISKLFKVNFFKF